MKIGQLAARLRLPVATLRYWEAEGLLPAAQRDASNYRRYGASHLERGLFVRNCRSLGMSQDEIKQLLALQQNRQNDCHQVNRIIDTHLQHLQDYIASLSHLAEQLTALRNQCQLDLPIESCPILRGLQKLESKEVPPSLHPNNG